MKNLPIGIQDFEKLREGDFLYVDKTETLFQLVKNGGYYFLSRPRRFGKSLTVSTLRDIFLGKKELFKGLWMEDKIDREPYPVIHISFSSLSTRPTEFRSELERKLRSIASENGLHIEANTNKELTEKLVKGLSGEKKVVILIDEYDKPIIDNLHNLAHANANREILKEFFEGLKDLDPYLRFVFITGVSKFSKVSVFSGLNNLQDITLHSAYSAICGYTQAELDECFGEAFPGIAFKLGYEEEEFRQAVAIWYNGYSWFGERVYNPWAILNLVSAGYIRNYWSGSGNPEFLLKRLHAGMQYNLDKVLIPNILLEAHSLENLDYRNLLFQTGYLTIIADNVREQTLTLAYPNREVKDSLLQLMFSEFAGKLPGDATPTALDLAQALREKDTEQVIKIIDSLFSGIPYSIFLAQYEAYYHSILHIMFSLLGFFIKSETPSAKGRADAVVHTDERIYVFEFKVDGTAEEAISQIREKGYAQPFVAVGKEIVLLGIALGKEKKGVSEWKEEIF